jgi:tetratricopeptide (TPR) repeat protein
MGNAEINRLVEIVEKGSASQREAAIAELVERAQASNEVDDWNAAGVGFHFAGDHDRAIEIFEALIAHDPAADSSRLTLATCYSQIEGVEQCRHHLRYLAEHASTEEMRNVGREELQGYETFLGLNGEERGLRRQLVQALRGKVGDPGWEGSLQASLARLMMGEEWEVSAYDSLARNLMKESMLVGDEGLAREALTVLERGTKAYPEEPALLEMLVACYLHSASEEKLDEALNTLKRLAPDSEVFRMLESTHDDSAREFAERMSQRIDRLVRTTNGKDLELRTAALADLRQIVARFPKNRRYRARYAFALMGAGEKEGALEQAERLADDAPPDHPTHFNLGQVFWHSGDPKRGRHHLELSLHYAESDDERRDVHQVVADLERRYLAELANSPID